MATKIAARLLHHRRKGVVLVAVSVAAAVVGGWSGHWPVFPGHHPGLGFFDGPL
ncbi:MAG TPA: hypothetical protein VFA05_08800 [Gaiellaceae bacterium]|nr:hypothetical protein [Gaiellaceae bacterium]